MNNEFDMNSPYMDDMDEGEECTVRLSLDDGLKKRDFMESGEEVTVKLEEGKGFGHAYSMDPVDVVLSDGRSGFSGEKIQSAAKNTAVYKPAGFLVCIEGPCMGEYYPLMNGVNTIGRGDQNIALKRDMTISRKTVAVVTYQEENRSFWVNMGEARMMIYMNDDLLMKRREMIRNDVLQIGDSCLMLIPVCDDRFSWAGIEQSERDGLF